MVEKEKVIDTILSVCKDLGLSVATKVKTDNWKADVVVDYGKYRVAFNVGRSHRNIDETYLAMRKEHICGCWFVLSPKFRSTYSKGIPCFHIENSNGNLSVFLNRVWEEETILSLTDFVASLIQGNIRYAKTMNVKYVDVRFFKRECWKCGRENDAYFVYKTISKEGIESEGGIECFNPMLVSGIRNYLSCHSEMNIVLGDIKPRYSRTVNDSYMSFGCAYCDSLFGDFFMNDVFSSVIYSAIKLPKALIEINDNITVDVDCWYIIK